MYIISQIIKIQLTFGYKNEKISLVFSQFSESQTFELLDGPK